MVQMGPGMYLPQTLAYGDMMEKCCTVLSSETSTCILGNSKVKSWVFAKSHLGHMRIGLNRVVEERP